MELVYKARRSKTARYMRITIRESGEVTLTLPRWASALEGDRFIRSRREWILKHLSRRSPVPDTAHNGRSDYLAHKAIARRLVLRKLAQWNGGYGHKIGKISIRNQKTVWGSCSRRGNLSFNYKIVFLPAELQDYLIVHELSHIKEMNHSPRFWALVGRSIKGYEACRRALRKRGPRTYFPNSSARDIG